MWPFKTETKAAPERAATAAPKQPQVMYLRNGTAALIIDYHDYADAQVALKHPIIYRALNKLCTAMQQARWFVELDPNAPEEDRAGKDQFIKDLQSVLDSPNNDMTSAQLRYWMALNYLLYGRVPTKFGFSSIKPNKLNAIYTLETQRVHAELSQRGAVVGFEYGTGNEKQRFMSKETWEKSTDKSKGFVNQIWKPALKGFQDKAERNTPLRAIGLPAKVITALMMRAISSAEGHPNCRYLVTTTRKLTDAQKETLREHLNEDYSNDGEDAGGVPILTHAGEIEIHKLDNDLSDIHSKTPSDDMARIIFGAFDIPIALAGIGAADSAKFTGNFDSSRLSFWQDAVIPGLVEPIFQGLTKALCPSGVRISLDQEAIPALVTGRILSMKEAKDIDFLTTNEKREIFGWPPTTEIPALPSAPVAATPAKEPSNGT